MHNPSIFIVVLNWNNYKDTAECLSSLQRLTYENYQIVLIDNASTDGSIERLQKEFPDVHVIINKENLGFAAGCNVGIRYSLEEGADAVLLINSDSVLESEALGPAVRTLFSRKDIGIVGGKIKQYHNPSCIQTTGVKRIIWPIMTARRVGDGELDKGQFDKREQRAAVIGALMLIKKEVFKVVGLLPEEYFFGCEDIDFCLSARKKGFRIMYEPRFVSYHKGGGKLWKSPKYVYSYFLHRQVLMYRHLNPLLWRVGRRLFISYASYWYKRHVKIESLADDPEKFKDAIKLAIDKGRFLRQVQKEALLKWWDTEMRPYDDQLER